jgi:hypothetical protein
MHSHIITPTAGVAMAHAVKRCSPSPPMYSVGNIYQGHNKIIQDCCQNPVRPNIFIDNLNLNFKFDLKMRNYLRVNTNYDDTDKPWALSNCTL